MLYFSKTLLLISILKTNQELLSSPSQFESSYDRLVDEFIGSNRLNFGS